MDSSFKHYFWHLGDNHTCILPSDALQTWIGPSTVSLLLYQNKAAGVKIIPYVVVFPLNHLSELKFEFTKKKIGVMCCQLFLIFLFSFPPLDCLLPAQQYHGPGPVLCHIFQVSESDICHLDNDFCLRFRLWCCEDIVVNPGVASLIQTLTDQLIKFHFYVLGLVE